MIESLPNIKDFRHKRKIEMRWVDVDELRHINNSVYLTYFEQGRLHYLHEVCKWNWKKEGLILANVSINFIRPLFLKDTPYLYIRCTNIGNKSFILNYLILNEQGDSRAIIATGSTVMVMFDYKANQSVSVPDRIRQELIDYENSEIIQK